MNLIPFRRKTESRSEPALSLQSYIELLTSFSFNGVNYTIPGSAQEEIRDFSSLVRGAYKASGVVFACMDVRAKLFAEASFAWRQMKNGRPGKLFGTPELVRLEVPWQGGTTGDLLARMIQYVDIAGNAFVVRRPQGVALLRPDWVDIVTGTQREDGDAWDVDARVVGYIFHPGGRHSGRPPETFLPEEVAHWAPIPDPEARFRGMSWLTPVLREIMADKAATQHKQTFFDNGATPNMKVSFDLDSVEKMRPWIEMFREQHEGALNAYKTLFLGAGTTAEVIGKDFKEMDFKVTQGAGETRIAAAAGVPPVIVGLSEGLQAATYSNYSQARRRFADGTMRPLWRNCCGSLAPIMQVPSGAELWYDDRDVPALKEDIQDKAKEMQEKATAANQLISAGWKADAVVNALEAGDFSLLLGEHTNLTSVQLVPPGKDTVADPGANKVSPQPVNGGGPAAAGANGGRSDDRELVMLGRMIEAIATRPIEVTTPDQHFDIHLPENMVASHVTVEAPPAAEASRTQIDVHVPEQESPTLTVEEGAIQSHITVEPAQVDVTVPERQVDVTVEQPQPPAVNVTVEPAQVDVHLPSPPQPRRATAKRNEAGELEVSYETGESE